MYFFFLKDNPTAFSPLGGGKLPTQGKKKKTKKKTEDPMKLGNRKVTKPHRVMTQCPAPRPK